MKTPKTKRTLLTGIIIFVIFGTMVLWLSQEVEYARFDSPSKNHTAVVSYRRYNSYLPMSPGQSGDKAGFIRIEGKDGRSYGKAKIPMLWMSQDLEWMPNGAALKFVCEWNFSKREYRLWNDSQTK